MMDNKNRPNIIIGRRILGWGFLLLSFAAICAYISFHGSYALDADMSSEMVLAKQLAEENALISPNWWYSTELRVINTQLIFMPLFKLFDNWVLIRTLGSAIILLIYLLCYRFLLKSLGLQDSFPVSGAFLLLPTSQLYLSFVTFGLYYIPHICFSFLMLGLICRTSGKDKKGRIMLNVLLCILGLLAGLGGMRQLLIFNIPIVLAAGIIPVYRYFCLNNSRQEDSPVYLSFFVSAILCAVFSFTGCMLNSGVLGNIFSFNQFGNIGYMTPSFDIMSSVLRDWLQAFGFSEGRVFTGYTIYNFCCLFVIVLTIIALVQILRHKQRYGSAKSLTAFFLVSAALVYSLFFSCISLDHVTRYVLPVSIFALPVITIWISGFDKKRRSSKQAVAVICAVVVLGCAARYRNLFKTDTTAELRHITNILKNQGYTQGYSTFWAGNAITELSNGEIEVWLIRHYPENLEEIYPWLQDKAHAEKRPTGDSFLAISTEDLKCEYTASLPSDSILFCGDDFILYSIPGEEPSK